jgi:hypothetical protein
MNDQFQGSNPDPTEGIAAAGTPNPGESVEHRLAEAEQAADEDRLRALEELYRDLESALESDVDQTGPAGH